MIVTAAATHVINVDIPYTYLKCKKSVGNLK